MVHKNVWSIADYRFLLPPSMGPSISMFTRPSTKPWGLKWRSSVWFTTTVVGFGITTDLLVYSIIIPVMPFQLERLQYSQAQASALTGWLLCAYSVGLVLSTIPIAMFAEKSSSRRTPLVIGLLALLGAQVLLMEAPNYALMAVARTLQGISSSMIWIVGLALLCDTTPEHNVGRQLGIAMTGLSVGLMVGTPAGGTLYARFGFRAPFIFGEICTAVDLFLRLLIIEKDVAIRWGYDPATCRDVNFVANLQASSLPNRSSDPIGSSTFTPLQPSPEQIPALGDPKQNPPPLDPCVSSSNNLTVSEISLVRKPLPLLPVIRLLGQSSRAVVALTMSLIYGTLNTMQEPSLPLHLQSVWGYNSDKVGLVYMAALVPALISSPLSGLLADRIGSDYITSICLLLALPWWIVLTLRKSIALFVVSLAIQSFFVSGVVPPVTAELATVARGMQGVGYAHVYGAFNLAFGIGTAVGPILGGQIYGRAKHGWTALCCITAALIIVCIMLAFCYTGDDPLLSKMMRQQNWSQVSVEMKPLKARLKERATDNSEEHPA
ncbi:major facilitator superfamily domain-containing protein [Butyriboletus roseoflavus]|nr:major facilitator superfamily domain-containing protein [Butyriboletus roseoflavus]